MTISRSILKMAFCFSCVQRQCFLKVPPLKAKTLVSEQKSLLKMWSLRLHNFSAVFMFFKALVWLCILLNSYPYDRRWSKRSLKKKNDPRKGNKHIFCSEKQLSTFPCCSTQSTIYRTCIDTYSKYFAYLLHPYTQKGSSPTHELIQAKQF